MATFDGKFIRGAAGDLIFKKNGKKQIVQGKSKKAKIDMTQATFDAAFVFGRASTLASYIRGNAEKIVRFYDGGMISRFTGECNQILQKATISKDNLFDFSQDYFSRLNGFEFNEVSPVKNFLFAQPDVILTERTITINLPEIQIPKEIKFPATAKYCIVAFSVTLFDLKNDQFKSQEIQSFEIELNEASFKAPPQQLNFEGSPGVLCVIALGLYYFEKTFAGKIMINNKDLSPSAILKAAFCPGEIEIPNKWSKMIFNEKKTRKLKKPKKLSDQTT